MENLSAIIRKNTDCAEGVFSILKRGLTCVYHQVGQHHLHGYLNMRKEKDGYRTLLAQTGCGKAVDAAGLNRAEGQLVGPSVQLELFSRLRAGAYDCES